jgi:DNA-binding response OmpR family regulator
LRDVLVCDDDDAIRELLKRVLVRAGFSVDLAKDGEEALTLIHQREYALLILDLMMPRMNGYDVIAQLKTIAKRPPVLVLTANLPTVTESFDPAIVYAVMRKPFDLEMLTTIVSAVSMRGIEPRASEGNAPDLRDRV